MLAAVSSAAEANVARKTAYRGPISNTPSQVPSSGRPVILVSCRACGLRS